MTAPGGGGFSFGTPQTQASPFGGFGMQSSQPTAPTTIFGAAQTVPPTGVVQPFSFGTPSTSATGTANPFTMNTGTAGMNPTLTFGSQLTGTTQQPFGFGAAAPSPPAGFAINAPTPTASFGGFGSSMPSTTPSFGSFGTSQVTQPSATFGTPQTTQAAVGFGTAPTGFGGFGATTTSAPASGFVGFGTPATSAPIAVGFAGFGTTSAPTTAFGAQPAQSTGGFSGFSAAPASTAAPAAFGGFTPTPITASQSTGFLPFGSVSTATATTVPALVQSSAPAFSFGTTTTTAGFGIGTQSAAASSAPFGGFGATTTPSGAVTTSSSAVPFSFGTVVTTAPTTTTSPLGGTSVSAAPPISSLTTFGSFTAPSTVAATLSTTTAAAPALSFSGFGAVATTAGPTALGTSLLTATTSTTTYTSTASSLFGGSLLTSTTSGATAGFGQTATTSTGFSLGGLSSTSAPSVVPSTPTTTSAGLGGVDILPASSAAGAGKGDKAVKESTLPNEIVQTVESFKTYVNQQKEVREEISRISVSRLIAKVQEETNALRQLLSTIESGLQRNTLAVNRLKEDTAQVLKNAEVAHHTKETPAALQYENTAPTVYFQKLVASFIQQMKLYKQQIQELEQHFASMSSSSALTPQDLTLLVRRQHETFVSLAAQLHSLHDSVQKRKEEYQGLRRGTSAGALPSESQTTVHAALNPPVAVTLGPAPFSNTRSDAALAMAQALDRAAQLPAAGTLGVQPALGGLNTSGLFGAPSTFTSPSLFGSASSPFKPLGGDAAVSQVSAQPFQLQKPPPGNKRGKK